MPRVTLPPTPASSTDIKGKDGTGNVPTLHLAFELPPPALTNDPRIVSPTEMKAPARSRRRSSATTAEKDKEFALPPPPTRSRKIIQMKPKVHDAEGAAVDGEEADTSGPKTTRPKATTASPTASANATPTTATAGGGGRKKQPSATSVAGRKIARKTAHSLIERRRRSKMNEEFAVLKGMIPACTGEMHKLAILQASIEYVRYLEDCVAKLMSQNEAQQQTHPASGPQSVASDHSPIICHEQESYGHGPAPSARHQLSYGDTSVDVEMAGASSMSSAAPSPTYSTNHQSSISPALRAEDSSRHKHRQSSYSSASTDRRPGQQHYGHGHDQQQQQQQQYFGQSLSATTSPAFGPQPSSSYANSCARGNTISAAASALTSPALEPQRDLDHEATAALLMLNSDRRGFAHDGGGGFTPANGRSTDGGTQKGGTGRGMSVRDLLST